MTSSELKEKLLSGDRRVAKQLINASLISKDPEGFLLAHLAQLEYSADVYHSYPWDELIARLDTWPHLDGFASSIAVEVALSYLPSSRRSLPAHWRERLLDGRPCPWASLAQSLNLYPESADTLRDWSRRLSRVEGYTPSWLSFYSKTWRSADYSFLVELLDSPLCSRLAHCSLELPFTDKSLRALLAALAVKNIASLSLSGTPPQLKTLLASSVLIPSLSLQVGASKGGDRSGVTPAELEALASSALGSQLTSLDLSHNRLTDTSLAALARCGFPALRSLDLSYNHFGAKGLSSLVEAPWWGALKELRLHWITDERNVRLSNDGLRPLLDAPQSIELLSLQGDGLKGDILTHLSQRLTSLRDLDLYLNDTFTHEALRSLLLMPSLVQVDLSHCVDLSGKKFLASLPELGPSLLRLRLTTQAEEIDGALALASAPWRSKVDIETNGVCRQLLLPGQEPTINAVLTQRVADMVAAMAGYEALSSVKHVALRWPQGSPDPEHLRALVASPYISGLRSLSLEFPYGSSIDTGPLLDALSAGAARSLQTLCLSNFRLKPADLQRFLQRGASLPLRSLLLLRASAGFLTQEPLHDARSLDALALGEDTFARGGWLRGVLPLIGALSLRRLLVEGRFSAEETSAFLSDPGVASLEHLCISQSALVAALPGVESIELHRCQLAPNLFDGLRERTERVFLHDVSLELAELRALTARPLRSLGLHGVRLNEEHISVLLSSPAARSLEYLDLSGNKLSIGAMRRLVESKVFSALRSLDVFDAQLDDELAEPLLSSMERLETIMVGAGALLGSLQKRLKAARPQLEIKTFDGMLSEERARQRMVARLCVHEPDASLPLL